MYTSACVHHGHVCMCMLCARVSCIHVHVCMGVTCVCCMHMCACVVYMCGRACCGHVCHVHACTCVVYTYVSCPHVCVMCAFACVWRIAPLEVEGTLVLEAVAQGRSCGDATRPSVSPGGASRGEAEKAGQGRVKGPREFLGSPGQATRPPSPCSVPPKIPLKKIKSFRRTLRARLTRPCRGDTCVWMSFG